MVDVLARVHWVRHSNAWIFGTMLAFYIAAFTNT